MDLETPLLLLLLAPVSLAGAYALLRARPAARFASLRLHLEAPVRGLRVRLRWLPAALLAAAGALMALALAGPRRGIELVHSETEGVDMALCLDVSGSMAERDMDRRRSRLEVAKEVVADFADKRAGDNLALVIFGARAYRAVPLTPDRQLLRQYLEQVEIGLVDPNRTAIGDALGRAVDVLRPGRARSKLVILLTDGSNNAGALPPLSAAEAAKALDIRVYTVGAGSTSPDILTRHPVDIELLQKISEATGGRFFRAEDRDGLVSAYREIDRLEKTVLETVVYRRYRQFFPHLLAAALACLLVSVALSETLLAEVPA